MDRMPKLNKIDRHKLRNINESVPYNSSSAKNVSYDFTHLDDGDILLSDGDETMFITGEAAKQILDMLNDTKVHNISVKDGGFEFDLDIQKDDEDLAIYADIPEEMLKGEDKPYVTIGSENFDEFKEELQKIYDDWYKSKK